MKQPSFAQLSILIANEPEYKISKLISEEYFIISFVEHLKEYFLQTNKSFKILVPLLDPFFEENQNTTLSIDEVELGELFYLINSLTDNSSLVYSSTSSLMEINIMDFKDYDSLFVSEYILLLYEFASMLIGESVLYKELKKL